MLLPKRCPCDHPNRKWQEVELLLKLCPRQSKTAWTCWRTTDCCREKSHLLSWIHEGLFGGATCRGRAERATILSLAKKVQEAIKKAYSSGLKYSKQINSNKTDPDDNSFDLLYMSNPLSIESVASSDSLPIKTAFLTNTHLQQYPSIKYLQ